MNKHLLTLTAGLALCAGQVFAQESVEKTFDCVADTWIRSNNENASGSSNTSLEFRKDAIKDGEAVVGYANWVALLGFDYNVPAGKKVMSATLKLVTERNKGGDVSLRGFSGNVSDNSTWATEGANVEAALKNAPISISSLAGQYPKALFDGGINEDNQNLDAWTNNIDVTSYLQSLGSSATRVNFMLSQDGETSTNDTRVYSKENTGCETKWGVTYTNDQLKPALIVTFIDESAVTYIVKNENTGVEYASLTAAWKAAASDEVLLLNKDVTLGERLNTDQRNITVRGNGNVTISRADGYKGMLFLTSKSGDEMTLENLTIDDKNIAVTGQTIEAGNNGTTNLKNVKIVNSSTTSQLGVIGVKGGGRLNAENLEISDFVVPEGMASIFVGSPGSSISGDCTFSMFVEKNNSVNAEGLVAGKITLNLGDDTYNHNLDAPVVTAANDINLFASGSVAYKLQLVDGNVSFVDSTTAISEITVGENRMVNVYNMQGILVRANVSFDDAVTGLPAGIYIAGGKKICVK